MKPLLWLALLFAATPARASEQWMVVHSLAPEVAEDAKLADDIIKLTRGRVLAIGVALVTDEAVEESRTALGMTEVSLENLPTLLEGVEASHGLLVSVTPNETKLQIAVQRYDIDTEITTIVRKETGKPGLKRALKKSITDAIKPPKARKKKKKKKLDAEAPDEIDPEFRRVGCALTNVEADVARELGLKRPSGVQVTDVLDGRVAARFLRIGDIILKLDRRKVKTPGELAGLLLQAELGDTFPFEVWRDGAKTRVELLLGPEPEPPKPEPETEPEAAEPTDVVADAGGEPPPPEEPPPPPRKLGIRVRVVSPKLAESIGLLAPTGALVRLVKPDSVGERAKLAANDVILTINEKPVTHARHLSGMVEDTYPRQRVTLEVWRERKKIQIQATFNDTTTASAERKTTP